MSLLGLALLACGGSVLGPLFSGLVGGGGQPAILLRLLLHLGDGLGVEPRGAVPLPSAAVLALAARLPMKS